MRILHRPHTMKETFNFLDKLAGNNNRDWFQANREHYEAALKEMISFADHLLSEMQAFDQIETPSGKKSLYRIYRDVRFSKDKTPYKTHWAGRMKRAGADRRGGYYYLISPEQSYVMGGFFGPNTNDLLHIRNQLVQDPDSLREIINSKVFKEQFGELVGEQVKTKPKGFSINDPAIDLVRHKQFIVKHEFTSDEVRSVDFPKVMAQSFHQMRPFLDYMTDILTTDLNGVPIV